MEKLKVTLVALTLLCGGSLFAQDLNPEKIKYVVRSAYLPAGFDSNDKAQLVVEGTLPNTCYRTGTVTVKVNKETKKIEVRQRVLKYGSICLYMIVPFHKVVDVGVLPEGQYDVVNEDDESIGTLPVKKAITASADEHLYSPVTDSRVQLDENEVPYVHVEGEFSNSCMRMKELRVFADGKRVVTVLPISEKVSANNCVAGSFRFDEKLELPKMPKGKYLLNTRSLNGEAIYRLFEVDAWQ